CQARSRRRRAVGDRRPSARSGVARAFARGPAHLRLLRVDGRVRAHRKDRPRGRLRAASGAERLPVVELGHPGGVDEAVPAHRDRPGLRGRGARCRPGAGGGPRPGVATSGGQTEMIRVNPPPARGGRRGAGFRLSPPAFNLAWLFGVVSLALLLGVGVYWWILISTKASLTADIDRAQRDLAGLKG